MHIFTSNAKILGEKLFRTREIPQSGSKAEDGGGKKEERKLVITMAKLRMAHASRLGQQKSVLTIASYACERLHRWRTQFPTILR